MQYFQSHVLEASLPTAPHTIPPVHGRLRNANRHASHRLEKDHSPQQDKRMDHEWRYCSCVFLWQNCDTEAAIRRITVCSDSARQSWFSRWHRTLIVTWRWSPEVMQATWVKSQIRSSGSFRSYSRRKTSSMLFRRWQKSFGNHRQRDHSGRGDPQRLRCPGCLAELWASVRNVSRNRTGSTLQMYCRFFAPFCCTCRTPYV